MRVSIRGSHTTRAHRPLALALACVTAVMLAGYGPAHHAAEPPRPPVSACRQFQADYDAYQLHGHLHRYIAAVEKLAPRFGHTLMNAYVFQIGIFTYWAQPHGPMGSPGHHRTMALRDVIYVLAQCERVGV